MATPRRGELSGEAPLVIDGDVIIAQEMDENYCALTFDDGPSPHTTPRLLDMLASYGIPATFFMVGRNAEHHPELVRRIEAEGHEVANHSYSHPNLRKLSLERKRAEIASTDAILRSIGVTPRFMRPPYGAYDEATENIARDLGLSIVLWSVDSKDWKRLPANYMTLPTTQGFVYPQGEMRGVFLFHDIHERTVNDLPRIVSQLASAGCRRFVTMSEYMDKMEHNGLRMARRTRPHVPAGFPTEEQLAAAQRAMEQAMAAQAGEDATVAQEMAAPDAPAMAVPEMSSPQLQKAWPAGSAPLPFARCSKPGEREEPRAERAAQAPAATQPASSHPQTTASPDVDLQAAKQAGSSAFPYFPFHMGIFKKFPSENSHTVALVLPLCYVLG